MLALFSRADCANAFMLTGITDLGSDSRIVHFRCPRHNGLEPDQGSAAIEASGAEARRRVTCCFPKGSVTSSCWKPKWRRDETKNGRPAGHLSVDGPEDTRCAGTAARLWSGAAHRADQR